jgi:hypothetical protein
MKNLQVLSYKIHIEVFKITKALYYLIEWIK